MHRAIWIMLVGGIALAGPALAQQRGFDRGAMLRRLDTDGDGLLERDEIPERFRSMYERRAKAAGGDLAQGVKIDDIVKQADSNRQRFGRGWGSGDSDRGGRRWGRGNRGQGNRDRGGGGRWGGRGGDRERGQDRRDNQNWRRGGEQSSGDGKSDSSQKNKKSKPKPDPKKEPAAQGFGVNTELPKVPGFGPPEDTGRGAADANGLIKPNREQLRKFAKNILTQNDRNKNGVLEKSEWESFQGQAEQFDRNHDNMLTIYEITAYLMGISKRARTNQANLGSNSTQGERGRGRRWGNRRRSDWEDSDWDRPGDEEFAPEETPKKSYRFYTPHERLPAGLPGWFTGLDDNGDGQIAMAEYASQWSDSMATEFADYDANGDGMITPRECLDSIEYTP